MDLYHLPLSPYAMKVILALYEKGLDFREHVVDSPSAYEALDELNPRREVPALRDGETVVYDSRVICDYLDERYPERPLLPPDPAERARCRTLELVADTQLDPCVVLISLSRVTRPDLAEREPGLEERAAEVLERHYANLERALGDREWFGGVFSRADMAIAPHLATADFLQHGPGGAHPRLAAWLRRTGERESMRRMREKAIAYFQKTQGQAREPRTHWRGERIEWAIRLGLGSWLLEEIEADRAFFSPVP